MKPQQEMNVKENNFKKGDKVIIVKDGDNASHYFYKGETATILQVKQKEKKAIIRNDRMLQEVQFREIKLQTNE